MRWRVRPRDWTEVETTPTQTPMVIWAPEERSPRPMEAAGGGCCGGGGVVSICARTKRGACRWADFGVGGGCVECIRGGTRRGGDSAAFVPTFLPRSGGGGGGCCFSLGRARSSLVLACFGVFLAELPAATATPSLGGWWVSAGLFSPFYANIPSSCCGPSERAPERIREPRLDATPPPSTNKWRRANTPRLLRIS